MPGQLTKREAVAALVLAALVARQADDETFADLADDAVAAADELLARLARRPRVVGPALRVHGVD